MRIKGDKNLIEEKTFLVYNNLKEAFTEYSLLSMACFGAVVVESWRPMANYSIIW